MAFDNCWICNGWVEIRFKIEDGCSSFFTGDPVFLHLDFENYRPMYMDKDPEDPSSFVLNRMCPPNRDVCFFFSDPCKNVIYTSTHYKTKRFYLHENLSLDLFQDGSDPMVIKEKKKTESSNNNKS